ncbi:MAG: ribosomal protein S18-alanine N-acetyltransferase [Gemmatimonadota bacterium]|nr:ribosomal protein S18-alanine N-acetyltransferase [Gemmatimonadota bacterium]
MATRREEPGAIAFLPDDIRVRAATADDICAVTTIERASFSDPWSAASFTGLVDDARVLFAVAEDASGVVGYVVAWVVADEAEVANLAVTPSSRRGGTGAKLLDAALEFVIGCGAVSVFLEVRASNQAARALYKSRGFEELSRRKNYYQRPLEDALVLRLMRAQSN